MFPKPNLSINDACIYVLVIGHPCDAHNTCDKIPNVDCTTGVCDCTLGYAWNGTACVQGTHMRVTDNV